jgi:hypothetical protein
MSAPVEVCCFACGAQACVNRVTAGLQCRCGSVDVDLYDGSPEQLRTLAVARIGQQGFLEFMQSLTFEASAPVGDEIKGWNVYQGPPPGPNPWGPQRPASQVCPICHGSQIDVQDGGPCRECETTGRVVPTTAVTPPLQVARHPGTSTQTKVPFMGRRRVAAHPSVEEVLRETTPDYSDRGGKGPKEKDEPFRWNDTNTHYPRADTMSPATRYREQRDYSQAPPGHFAMPGASCPNCGQDPTHLVKDHKENAWWHCPNCGPLANIDKHPEIDPYRPTENFLPNPKGFKTSKVAYAGNDRGSLLRMIAVAQEGNPGLSVPEVIFLVRNSASRYLEQS